MWSCDEILKHVVKQSFYKDEFDGIEPIEFFTEFQGYWVMTIENADDTFYYVLEGNGWSLYEEEKFENLSMADRKFLKCVTDYLK